MQSRAWITQNFKVSKFDILFCQTMFWGFVAVSVCSLRFEETFFSSLSQESAYMFRFQKADPGGHLRRRIIHLHQAEGTIIPLLASWSRGLSLHTGAACLLTLLLRRRHLPQDVRLIPTMAMASKTATGWWISMRNTEPVRIAPQVMMTGVPSPLRLLPQPWLENVLEWGHLTHMSDAPSLSPLLLHPT